VSCSITKRHVSKLQQTKLETLSFVPGEGLCLDVEAMKQTFCSWQIQGWGGNTRKGGGGQKWGDNNESLRLRNVKYPSIGT